MFVRLAHNSKSPVSGELQKSDDPQVIAEWLRNRNNLGLLLKNRVVIDFDRNIEAAREHWRQTRCEVICKTARGFHFHYEGVLDKSRKFEHGDIKATGFILIPPSKINGHEYTFIRNGKLLPYDDSWFPPTTTTNTIRTNINDVRAYLAKVESFQGANGSAGLVRAIARCRDNGLTISEATIEILHWNSLPVVNPAWDEKSIARAITRIYEKGTR